MHFATKSAQDVRLQPFFEPEVALPSEIENHSDSDISSGGYRIEGVKLFFGYLESC